MDDLPTMSLYDFAEVDKINPREIGDSSNDFTAQPGTLSDLGDLDSYVEELSVDLQNLIDQSAREDATLVSPLFPDLPDTPTSCLAPVSDDWDTNGKDNIQVSEQEILAINPEAPSGSSGTGSDIVASLPLVMPISLVENYMVIDNLVQEGSLQLLPSNTICNDGETIIIQQEQANPEAASLTTEDIQPTSTAESPVALSFESEATTSQQTSLKSPAPSKSRSSRRKPYEKGSVEYIEKRERNNIAVRKSRDKAKLKQSEINGKVKELTDENQRLQKKVDLLSKELSVIKGLFANVGVSFPSQFKNLFE